MEFINNIEGVTMITYMDDNELVLDMIEVSPAYRGQGKGREAMELLIDFAQENEKIETIGLFACPQDAETDKERLIEFYENFGFCSLHTEDDGDLMEISV